MGENCIAMRYIDNPLLLNGLKFDLRIYVLVTSLRPLIIYVYNEGLTRFASEIYNGNKVNMKNTFAHLTNYAVNKHNNNFIYNRNLGDDDIGNKWSLSALFAHLEHHGVNTDLLWSRIYDIIIKTIIACLDDLKDSLHQTGLSNSNFFEMFGFDVLIDSSLKPWLLEVNMSASLDCDTPLDMHIKSHLISDTFNAICLKSKAPHSSTMFKTISVMTKGSETKKHVQYIAVWPIIRDLIKTSGRLSIKCYKKIRGKATTSGYFHHTAPTYTWTTTLPHLILNYTNYYTRE